MDNAFAHIATIWKNRGEPACAKVAFTVFWYAALVWVAVAVTIAFCFGGYLYFFSVPQGVEEGAPVGDVDTIRRELLTETIQLYDAKGKKFQELVDVLPVFPDPSIPAK